MLPTGTLPRLLLCFVVFATLSAVLFLTTTATASEIAIYSLALTTAQQDQFIAYAARKWGIPGGFQP